MYSNVDSRVKHSQMNTLLLATYPYGVRTFTGLTFTDRHLPTDIFRFRHSLTRLFPIVLYADCPFTYKTFTDSDLLLLCYFLFKTFTDQHIYLSDNCWFSFCRNRLFPIGLLPILPWHLMITTFADQHVKGWSKQTFADHDICRPASQDQGEKTFAVYDFCRPA